jgi:polyisoprenoid-binding protein YceI
VSTLSIWKIDPAHTDILFSAKHMMVSTVRGKFHEVEGTLRLDEADPTRSGGEFIVGSASLNTGVAQRDGHLRSADFFDAEQYPSIRFVATKVVPLGSDWKVVGDLTIRDVTREVEFDVELGGITTGMTGARHLGLTARTKIDREDWGLTWNVALEAGGWLVGREVKIEIDVAADEVAVAEGATEGTTAAPAGA